MKKTKSIEKDCLKFRLSVLLFAKVETYFQLDDPAGCEAGLTAHWSDIANALYPVYMEGNSVCGQLSVCYVRDITCDECVNGVGQIGGIISDPATVESVLAFLKVFQMNLVDPFTDTMSQADFCAGTDDEATCSAVTNFNP